MKRLVLLVFILLLSFTEKTNANELAFFKDLYLRGSSLVKKEIVQDIFPESKVMYVHLAGGDTGEGGGPQKDLIKAIKKYFPLKENIPSNYIEVVVNLKEIPVSSIETIKLNSISSYYISEGDDTLVVTTDEIESFYLDRDITSEDESPVSLPELMGFKLFSGKTYISTSIVAVKVKIMIVF